MKKTPDKDRLYYLMLSSTPGIGPKRLKDLINIFKEKTNKRAKAYNPCFSNDRLLYLGHSS